MESVFCDRNPIPEEIEQYFLIEYLMIQKVSQLVLFIFIRN